jgi:hypothetical protein
LLVDWRTYHNEKCKEHDFCGALQGCGQGEDIESLLHDVDACVKAEEVPNCTDAPDPDPDPCTEALLVSDHADVVCAPYSKLETLCLSVLALGKFSNISTAIRYATMQDFSRYSW